jgi:hypothetical protein
VEHLCELHGQQPPAWLEKPERFLKITWILPTTPTMVKEAIAFAQRRSSGTVRCRIRDASTLEG